MPRKTQTWSSAHFQNQSEPGSLRPTHEPAGKTHITRQAAPLKSAFNGNPRHWQDGTQIQGISEAWSAWSFLLLALNLLLELSTAQHEPSLKERLFNIQPGGQTRWRGAPNRLCNLAQSNLNFATELRTATSILFERSVNKSCVGTLSLN